MLQDTPVRVRLLNSDEVHGGFAAGWSGAVAEISLAEGSATHFVLGALVEMESEERLYLGVIEDMGPSGMSILVEHSIERSQLGWIQQVWG
jgi:hypothetical protein